MSPSNRHIYIYIYNQTTSSEVIPWPSNNRRKNGPDQHGRPRSDGRRPAGPRTAGARADLPLGPDRAIHSAQAGQIARGHVHGKHI